MTPHALLFTLAAIGISETTYLIRKRISQEKPICVLGEGCHQVLESAYNKIFGIHNDLLGLTFYVAVSLITAFLVIGIEPAILWDMLIRIFILGGSVMSAVLLYLQWRIIKAWCFWCVGSAITAFLMAIIAVTADLML